MIPVITGKAYVISLNRWFVDDNDPFKYGFVLVK
ncbi:proline racemase family protein [Clostridium bowmanii]|nr:proline racemase family protein [Clostridium bowmanii]